tara:strand:- start:588 stop:2564 length:1977 start_codon:yes stop_codon:yes gene_type:complete
MVLKHYKPGMFNDQQFPVNKSPNTYRIFCLGGSTTFGRPYDHRTSFCGWLNAYLTAADPTHIWEVINVGGISYASYRVAAMMAELNTYQPDLYIVYSGHNEFLEERTYREIAAMPEWIRDLSTELSRSRLYSELKRRIRTLRSPALEDTNDIVLKDEVDEILSHSVGPKSYKRDDALNRTIQDHYRFNVERMIRIAESNNTQIVFVQPAAKLHEETPFKSEHRDGINASEMLRWNALFQQTQKLYAQELYSQALKSIDQALEIDSRYAESHYWRGKILFALQNYSQARIAYQRSLDEDIAPLRILGSMQQTLFEIIQAHQVALIDFPAIIADASRQNLGHDLPGSKLFLDHVHPTIEMHQALGLALFERLKQHGTVNPGKEWNSTALEAATKSQLALVDKKLQREALHNLASVIRWSGKTEQAYALLLRSQQEFGNIPRTLTMLSTLAQRLGQTADALKHAYQATELYPEDINSWTYLASLYESNGQPAEAENTYRRGLALQPEHIELRQALSLVLIQTGRTAEAINEIERIVKLDPSLDEGFLNLGILYAELEQYSQSELNFRQALGLNPNLAYAYTGLAIIYERMFKYNKALQNFRRAQQLEPLNPEASNNLGRLLARSGDPASAIKEFEAALKLDPNYREAQQNLKIAQAQQQAH